ncbi:MAG: Verru_Chthon cassette protein D [Verrucomicrobiota bacterium]
MIGRSSSIKSGSGAFTLVELLVVILVVSILITISIGLNTSGLDTTRLVGDAEKFMIQLSLGQQTAIAENRPVEVRIYNFVADDLPDESERYRAYQLWRIQNDGSDAEPIGSPLLLNDGVVISKQRRYSSLVDLPTRDGEIYSGKKADYFSFQYLPNGETTLPPASSSGNGHWFLTFVLLHDEIANSDITDFVTVQIDPFTGSTRKLRL